MLRYLIFLALTVPLVSAENVFPLCQTNYGCSCSNDDSNGLKSICNSNIVYILFENSTWINKDNNQTFSYNSVEVHNSPILTLDKQFPLSNIKLLDLANNSIVNISDDIFTNLQQMETLILSYNNIELLKPNAFRGPYLEGQFYPLKSLRKLYLNHNRIHTLDSDLFEHIDSLKVLSLSHNPLRQIDMHTAIAITSLVYLEELDLSFTQISTLPDNFMHTPKYINILDLSGNAFTGIPKTLGQSHKLQTLYMNVNPIVNLTAENGFPNISTLKSLHMDSMPELINISKGALSNLENLEELYLFNNIKLFHIDKAALFARHAGAEYPTWPPIKKLYLQNNKLSMIDMELVLSWNNLQELDLTDNPWTCECENQWMADELLPIYLHLDETKAKALRCAAPIEMAAFSFYDIYKKERTMRCLDAYGHRPERDGALLVGLLAGVLVTIPLILFVVYAYQRHWFGIFDNSAASYSRQFYQRNVNNDEYF